MLLMLLKQSYEWSHTIGKDDVVHEMRYLLNNFLTAGKKLFNVLEKEFDKQGENINDIYWEESELISKFFEYLKKEEDLSKRNQLIEILRSYMNGTLSISYDNSTKDKIESGKTNN
jgi:aromatic ring hydroxylase